MHKTYTTIQGDMWDSIAKKKLGSENYMHLLLEANQEYRHFHVLPAGITLQLPEVPEQVTTLAPPWRR